MSTQKTLLTFSFLIIFSLLSQGIVLSQTIPFETIEKGDISQFRYGDPNFSGADMVIRDIKTWEWFWKRHTQEINPLPPLPKVNFNKHMVLVVMLGYQTSGGGPDIEIRSIKELWNLDAVVMPRIGVPKGVAVIVEENREPGPLDVLTNPYHIVKVKNYVSVLFEREPMNKPPYCSDNTGCSGNEYCERKLGDCDGEGICRPKPDGCILVYDPVCGCDGLTYGNACEAAAAGVSILHRGRCEDMKPCAANEDCGLSEFCLFPDGLCAGPGICTLKPRFCPLTFFACLPEYSLCGCDHKTYCNRCEAYQDGVSISHVRPCEGVPK